MNAPILTLEEALVWVTERRRQGKVIVFTNGHFDLLHLGHIRYLQAARRQGDCLIVGLNSDASTRLRKGPQRPIVPQEERAALLAALRCVDAIIPFDGEDCRDLVASLQPDVYVKGSDWNRPDGPRPPEAAVVAAYGGRVTYIDLEPGKSTTALINTVLTRYRETETERP